MPWHELSLVEPIWQQLQAVTEPTNPSTFILALVGFGTFLCYQIFARPGHGRKRLIDLGQPAKPQATTAVTEDRRVA